MLVSSGSTQCLADAGIKNTLSSSTTTSHEGLVSVTSCSVSFFGGTIQLQQYVPLSLYDQSACMHKLFGSATYNMEKNSLCSAPPAQSAAEEPDLANKSSLHEFMNQEVVTSERSEEAEGLGFPPGGSLFARESQSTAPVAARCSAALIVGTLRQPLVSGARHSAGVVLLTSGPQRSQE